MAQHLSRKPFKMAIATSNHLNLNHFSKTAKISLSFSPYATAAQSWVQNPSELGNRLPFQLHPSRCPRLGRFQITNPVVSKKLFFSSSSISALPTMPISIMKNWEDKLDPVQRKLLAEECILLDENDKVIGHDSKKNCHLIVNGDVKLHRAFSVFLFNSKGELLLQQRSKTKITFPNMWTNTCCSHPLFNPDEMEEQEALGIKVAARRRLEFELGIPQGEIDLRDFNYLTRIHYKALSDSIWGEHEIDYILFLQKDLQIVPNPDEVSEIRYVNLNQIASMVAGDKGVTLTPWFELILKSWLPLWWSNLHNLKQFENHGKIHKM